MTVTMAAREHHHVDRAGVVWFAAGRVPGTLVGLAFVTLAPEDVLTVTVGVLILAAVVLSALHPHLRVTRRTSLATGLTAGVTGTVAAIDGPPLALLYQRHPGHVIRPTLAACFVVASLMSTVGLAAAGSLTGDQLVLTLTLLPAMLVGLALSTLAARRLHGRSLQPAVLALAAVAGALAVAHGVL